MKWTFAWIGKKHSAEWSPGTFKTDFKLLEDSVMRFISWEREVKCGYLGSYLIAGLDTDVRVWGTISEAFGKLEWIHPEATLKFFIVPWIPVGPKSLNDLPDQTQKSVYRRSETVKRKVELTWIGKE